MPARYKKKSISKLLQRQVWAASFGDSVGKAKCLCCGMTDITQLSFVCGHIIAEANGGETSVNNMRAICMSCNQSMRTRSMLEFMESHSIDTTRILNTLRNTKPAATSSNARLEHDTGIRSGRDLNRPFAQSSRGPIVTDISEKKVRETTFREDSESSGSDDDSSESSGGDEDSECFSPAEARHTFAQFRCAPGPFYESLENTRKAFAVSPQFASSPNKTATAPYTQNSIRQLNPHLLSKYSPYFNNNASSLNPENSDSLQTMPITVPRPRVRFI